MMHNHSRSKIRMGSVAIARRLFMVLLVIQCISCNKDPESEGQDEAMALDMEDDSNTEETTSETITYAENNGIVSVEFETVKGEIDWTRGSSLEGFDGEGYLIWTNPDSFQIPNNGVLTYKLNISTPGAYRFIWHSRITHGESQSEANDSWLRFNDAADFFGERDGSIVYPKGTGKTPNPEGSSADGWFKVYMNRVGEWFWRSNTSDNDPHDIFVAFDTPGIYTMEVSGRSQYHGLDRFVLFIEGTTFEEAVDAPRSKIVRP